MISARPASQLSTHGKNFNVAIFLDTVNMVNVKLCMMVVLTELYPFMPLCDPDSISKSQQGQTVLMEHFMFFSN